MEKTEKDIIQELGKVLKSKRIKYLEDVIVGDSHPDLYFTLPTGSSYVVEVKTWQATPQNQKRARRRPSSTDRSHPAPADACLVWQGIVYRGKTVYNRFTKPDR